MIRFKSSNGKVCKMMTSHSRTLSCPGLFCYRGGMNERFEKQNNQTPNLRRYADQWKMTTVNPWENYNTFITLGSLIEESLLPWGGSTNMEHKNCNGKTVEKCAPHPGEQS